MNVLSNVYAETQSDAPISACQLNPKCFSEKFHYDGYCIRWNQSYVGRNCCLTCETVSRVYRTEPFMRLAQYLQSIDTVRHRCYRRFATHPSLPGISSNCHGRCRIDCGYSLQIEKRATQNELASERNKQTNRPNIHSYDGCE